MRRGQRWLTFIFVSTIGLVFVFFFGTGGGLQPTNAPTGNAIVQLDEVQLTQRDLARARQATEQRLRDQLGDAYEEIGADRFLDSQALSSLVEGVVLAAAARDLGLHVTKDELRRFVQASPAFIDDQGRFDPEQFDRFAVGTYGSQRLFIQQFTRELLGQKLIQLLVAQTGVSDAEIDLRARYEEEEVRIAYVALDPAELGPDDALGEAEIDAWATENAEELEALYAARAESLAEPDRVRARHVLIRAAPEAPDEIAEAARERARAARERIESGESFEAVAAEVSQDAGTAEAGGDLGVFARGDNDPALDDTAFSLEPGELSPVIRSSYGFHVLRVDEKLPARTPSFDELRDSLAREAAGSARARELASERAAALTAAIEAGSSLEDAARAEGLTLERPPALRRRPDGFVPGLGAAEALMTAAFTIEAGTSSPEVFEIGGRQVLVQVLDRTAPSAEQLAANRAARRQQVLTEKQNQIVGAWIDDYRTRLEQSGRLRINAELALGG